MIELDVRGGGISIERIVQAFQHRLDRRGEDTPRVELDGKRRDGALILKAPSLTSVASSVGVRKTAPGGAVSDHLISSLRLILLQAGYVEHWLS